MTRTRQMTAQVTGPHTPWGHKCVKKLSNIVYTSNRKPSKLMGRNSYIR